MRHLLALLSKRRTDVTVTASPCQKPWIAGTCRLTHTTCTAGSTSFHRSCISAHRRHQERIIPRSDKSHHAYWFASHTAFEFGHAHINWAVLPLVKLFRHVCVEVETTSDIVLHIALSMCASQKPDTGVKGCRKQGQDPLLQKRWWNSVKRVSVPGSAKMT